MNSKRAKQLRRIARQQAELPTNGKVMKTGAELLKENPDIKDEAGNPVKPKQRYSANIIKQVDHEKELKKAWKEGGTGAVQNYVRNVSAARQEMVRHKQTKAKVLAERMAGATVQTADPIAHNAVDVLNTYAKLGKEEVNFV